MEQQKQPKIVQKLLIRTFFLLLGVAAVFLGINWVLGWREDPDMGTADTNQMIAAIEILPEGQQAVIFDANNKKIPSPDYQTGKTDRDIVWLPDGNRIYFSSDRKESAYNLFRWNPARGTVDQKSTGSLSKFDASFPAYLDKDDRAAIESASNYALITQGGFVLEYDLKQRTSQQLLPPPSGVTVGAEEGSGGAGQFDALYKRYGNAVRTARWMYGGDYLAAVMKGDEQETLILQKRNITAGTPEEQAKEMAPRPIMAGDRVDMDVDPATGRLVFTITNFQFPDRDNIPKDYVKNGKIIKPLVHGVFILDPTKTGPEGVVPIAVSNDVKQSFGPPAVSPDGSQVLLTTGSYDGYTFSPAGLAVMPAVAGGMESGSPLVRGQIYEYSWHPSGSSLVYIKREGDSRAIFKINKDGSSETKVSDSGNYMTPKFSPQSK